jgi:hypothetical protein
MTVKKIGSQSAPVHRPLRRTLFLWAIKAGLTAAAREGLLSQTPGFAIHRSRTEEPTVTFLPRPAH